MADL
jgi:hypothetical protein